MKKIELKSFLQANKFYYVEDDVNIIAAKDDYLIYINKHIKGRWNVYECSKNNTRNPIVMNKVFDFAQTQIKER